MPHPVVTALDWVELMGFGALAGAVGQSARTIVGLKKLNDGKDPNATLSDSIDTSRLFVSLLIGAVAGVLAASVSDIVKDLDNITPQLFMVVVLAGYSGSDFIEGFMSKATSPGSAGNPAPAPSPAKAVVTDDAVG